MKKLTANILFSGIGAQERGFIESNLFDIDIMITSEIDKDAVVSYAAIHCGLTPEMIKTYNYPSKEEMVSFLEKINLGYNPNKKKPYNWNRIKNRKDMLLEKYYLSSILSKNMGDISKIEKLPAADLWTISFPCQDISIAGRMKGLKPDSGTISSLLWENIRLLKVAKESDNMPQYLMLENVKNLVGSKFIHDFEDLISILDELGYNTYWKVLNGKECGIPQNRERVFAFCFRKDIDKHCFAFPKPFDIGIRLKDILENSVSPKYYINTDKAQKLIKALLEKERVVSDPVVDLSLDNPRVKNIANCITARDRDISNRKSTGTEVVKKVNTVKQIGGLTESAKRKNPSANRVYDASGISPALVTSSGGGYEPKIIEKEIKGKKYSITSVQKDSVILEERQYGLYLNTSDRFFRPPVENISRCLKASQHDAGLMERIAISNFTHTAGHNNQPKVLVKEKKTGIVEFYSDKGIIYQYRIRMLTPKECMRLMGFHDADTEKCYAVGLSDSQLYNQTGNSIITNCCELLAEHLYKAQYDSEFVCKDKRILDSQNGTQLSLF